MIPNGTTKLTVSGTQASGAERFAFSLYFTGYPGYPSAGYLDPAILDSGSTSWNAFINAVLACCRPDTVITAYDVYYYTGGVAVSHQTKVVSKAGTGTSTTLPLQVSCVLTLRSGLSTRSGRGRIYVPTTGLIVSTGTYLFSTGPVQSMVSTLATFFTFVKSVSPQQAVVVSQTHSSTQPIVSVDANYVPDTQRRRANRLTSTRFSATV